MAKQKPESNKTETEISTLSPASDAGAQNTQASEGETNKVEALLSKLLDFLDEKKQNSSAVSRGLLAAPGNSTEFQAVQDTINEKLTSLPAVAVAFPPCSDVLLALIDQVPNEPAPNLNELRINHLFAEYFGFFRHTTVPNNDNVADRLRLTAVQDRYSKASFSISFARPGEVLEPAGVQYLHETWPPDTCLAAPVVGLNGNRRIRKVTVSSGSTFNVLLGRLFLADLAYLFYLEWMGIFQMLGRILEEYAYRGGIPMLNGSDTLTVKDDMVTMVLEAMTRQTESGTASKVRDRASTYRRVLGWNSEAGRSLDLSSEVNTAFNFQFHKLIKLVLDFYKDKRLAVAIRGNNGNDKGITSAATLTTISNTISLLKKSFELFRYGRNYHNTLSGLVWAISGFKLVEELRQTIGIPPEYSSPTEFIPAAYDILVLKRPVTSGDSNRFETYMECARNIREILLDLEVLNFSDTQVNGALDQYLEFAEPKIEGYRTAYRTLTGVDLDASPSPVIAQQA